MKIKVAHAVKNLQFSKPLKELYPWYAATRIKKHGWRLPRRDELILLYELVPKSRCDKRFWSSSVYTNNSRYAWWVGFNNGDDYLSYKHESYSVMLVREIGD